MFLPKNEAGEALCSKEIFEWVKSQPGVSWARLPASVTRGGKAENAKARMVHAKVYRFFSAQPKREFLFVGSANLTGPAHRRGGNLETGFLVELDPPRRPDWWMERDGSKPTIYESHSEDEGAVSNSGSRLSLRYWWDSKLAKAYWDDPGRSRTLSVSWSGGALFEIDPLESRQWTDVPAIAAAALEQVLRSTSILLVEGDRAEVVPVLVQEEGMKSKPSALFDLSPSEILRYWSLLTTEQRAAFLEAQAPEAAIGDDANLVTRYALAGEKDTFFDRFAGIFISFGNLERHIRESLKAGNDRPAEYRLFGQKYDSLGHLLDRVRDDSEKSRDEIVEHYVMALCARQTVTELRRFGFCGLLQGARRRRSAAGGATRDRGGTPRSPRRRRGSDNGRVPELVRKMVPAPSGAGRPGGQRMIDIAAAQKLINFNASNIGQARAEEQLAGAVAMHNILERHNVAYLADEVGMGKTYVALGAMALFRHFDPEFRVLVIAPRENIQRKWMKELGNFVKNNFQFPDLRVKSLRGGPARPIVMCNSLGDFVHQVSVDSRRDFFLRMSSFSFGLSKDPEQWKTQRDNLRRELPWLADEVFDLRSKEAFKDNFARAVCCALPKFDLVIVDEGHNLKRGFHTGVAARNRIMALAFGRSPEQIDDRLFPGYGKRAQRVLFLSATPIEDSYEHLWNQLDVFGLGGLFSDLKGRGATDEEKKRTAAQFLVRRVTTLNVNGHELTKNQYRREWRQGGVSQHDQPSISVTDPEDAVGCGARSEKSSGTTGLRKV